MFVVSWIATIIYYVLLIFVFAMWGRLIVDFIRAFKQSWRPAGPLLVVVNLIYTITDPPLKRVRRFVKPISFGAVALDFGWTVVMLAAVFAMYVTLLFR